MRVRCLRFIPEKRGVEGVPGLLDVAHGAVHEHGPRGLPIALQRSTEWKQQSSAEKEENINDALVTSYVMRVVLCHYYVVCGDGRQYV